MKEFRKTINGLFICEECNRTFATHQGIGTHIGRTHHSKKYYDKWLKDDNDGICKICGDATKFKYLSYSNTCCKKCGNIYCHEQTKIGMLQKYGVTYVFHSKKSKEKALKNIKLSNLKNYGVEYPFQLTSVQDKIKENNVKEYGVENQFQRKEIKEKSKQTKKERYGDENYNNQEKYKQTCLKNHGFEHVLQNKEIHEKQLKSAFKLKQFKDTNLQYQGSYEEDLLNKYYDKFPDIIRGPVIKYMFEGKNKIYHPDFYIPSLNLIIECKNKWLMKRDNEEIELKQKATISNGFNYLVIIDKDYNIFNELIKSLPTIGTKFMTCFSPASTAI